jgi:hypothetical protein
MSIEAMKLALEALIAVEALIEHQYTGTRDGMTAFQDAADDAHLAIKPLRQAIEQAGRELLEKDAGIHISQQKQEPVIDKSAAIRIATALGWTPPRHPLSDEEIKDITADIHGLPIHVDDYTFARAIEAAHGIKG